MFCSFSTFLYIMSIMLLGSSIWLRFNISIIWLFEYCFGTQCSLNSSGCAKGSLATNGSVLILSRKWRASFWISKVNSELLPRITLFTLYSLLSTLLANRIFATFSLSSLGARSMVIYDFNFLLFDFLFLSLSTNCLSICSTLCNSFLCCCFSFLCFCFWMISFVSADNIRSSIVLFTDSMSMSIVLKKLKSFVILD